MISYAFRHAAFVCVVLLAGCAQQMIRDEADTRLREGNYELALQGLQAGVTKYPDSPLLRAGLTATKAEAISKLTAEAAQQRASGKFDEAAKTIARALGLDAGNDRLLALQADLAGERRAQGSLNEAQSQLAAGKKDLALRTVQTGLRDAPRQPALLALQRRLEGELRAESSAGQRTLAETRAITLDFRNAPLSSVLEAMTRGSGINFILDRDVKQDTRVTIFLRSTKLEDALDLVTGAHQLARRVVDPQTVLIYPNTPEKNREHQEQVIRVFHLANADAKSTANLLRNMLRLKDPFVDEKANMIALRESPEIIALAEKLVALHDIGEAEVMLEVEILEIKTSRLTELGVNFPNSFSLTPLPPTGASGLTVANLDGINSGRIGVGVAGLLVNLRREVGDFNILANPKIRTRNRERARILIGDKVPIITSTANATGFVSESVNYLDVGLKLDVEPVVSPDDEVSIKLALEVSTLAKEVRTQGGSIAYQIGTRNANTVLRLRDGETQLLAGLISNEDRTSANRVPGLGDLPVAGRLFSSQKDEYLRTELVLAITPRILRGAPRPDAAQAEMWVGSEQSTRLRAMPGRPATATASNVVNANAPGGPTPVVPGLVALSSGGSGQLPPPPYPGPQAGVSVVGAAATSSSGPVNPEIPRLRAFWQAPSSVAAGDVFVVTLSLASPVPLRGLPLELSFSSQALEVLEVNEGTYFKQGNGTTSFTQAVNPATGRVNVGVLRNDASGASGQGAMLHLRLKAKTAGPLELGIASVKPIVLQGTPPPADLPSLRMTVK